jgi:hypothetical protein
MIIDRTRTIQIIAIKRQFKQLGKSFFLRPIWDARSRRFVTGLELLPPELGDRLKKEYIPTDEHFFAIRDGDLLKLNDDVDLVKYMLSLVSPDIAMSRTTVNGIEHLFYLHDEIEEADQDNTRINKIAEAITFTEGLSEKDMMGVAAYLDINIRELPHSVVLASVRKMCLSDPDMILKFKAYPNQSNLIFVHKLIVYEILSVQNDGIYFRDKYLSGTKDELLEKLNKDDFKGTFNQLYMAMQAVENPGSKAQKIVLKEVVNEAIEDKEKEFNEKLEFEKKKFEYFKLFGKEWAGDDDLSGITKTIDNQKKKLEEVEEFKTKYADADIAKLKNSAVKRGIDESLYLNVTDPAILKQVITNHILNK